MKDQREARTSFSVRHLLLRWATGSGTRLVAIPDGPSEDPMPEDSSAEGETKVPRVQFRVKDEKKIVLTLTFKATNETAKRSQRL